MTWAIVIICTNDNRVGASMVASAVVFCHA